MKKKSDTVFDIGHLDPFIDVNGGFLSYCTYWQPDLNAVDPEMPGLKQQMISYISILPSESCLCGSGQSYEHCCRTDRYWRMVCPNVALEGYSLLAPQEAIYDKADGNTVHKLLINDARFQCVEDSKKRSFWILCGDPAFDSQYGVNCFGDIELQGNRKLIVTAMSNNRMRLLLDILSKMIVDFHPIVTYDAIYGFKKQTDF